MSLPSTPALETTQPTRDARDLDRSLLHGVVWTSGAKWASQLLAWVSTIIVARLLSPEDYGLVGMASIYLGLITLLSEFGLGAAVVTLRDLREEQVAQLNALSLLFGVAGLLVSGVVAIPMGRFFRGILAPDKNFIRPLCLDDAMPSRSSTPRVAENVGEVRGSFNSHSSNSLSDVALFEQMETLRLLFRNVKLTYCTF